MKDQIRSAVSHLNAPFAVLDLDAVMVNAEDMVRRAGGTPIRLASKSIRIRSLLSRILELPSFQGILSYHLNEALWLVDEGVSTDILVAYPTADENALARFVSQQQYREAITLMVDSLAHVDLIDRIVPPAERGKIRLCVDLDASLSVGPIHLGALRSPLHSAEQFRQFFAQLIRRPGYDVVGIMAYEGQIAGTTDTSFAVSLMKKLSATELAGRRDEVVSIADQELATAGLPPLEFVNGGGTGSLETTSAESAVTEIGAGSGLIGSGLFDHYKTFAPIPAEWFVLPVVRRPCPDTVTVAGGGRIASGPAGADRLPTIDYPEGLSMSLMEGPGEVQTPLTGAAARTLHLGDHVWFRHAKAGEQTEWVNSVQVVSGGRIIDEWLTYRGEGQTFV